MFPDIKINPRNILQIFKQPEKRKSRYPIKKRYGSGLAESELEQAGEIQLALNIDIDV